MKEISLTGWGRILEAKNISKGDIGTPEVVNQLVMCTEGPAMGGIREGDRGPYSIFIPNQFFTKMVAFFSRKLFSFIDLSML